jgi:hypothetical protein
MIHRSHVVIKVSNKLFFIMFLMIPRNPVDTTTNEMNLRHFLSEIIVVKISRHSARFTYSNLTNCDISLNFFHIDMFESTSISFTERFCFILLWFLPGKYKILP